MDLNYFVHNMLLSTDSMWIYTIAEKVYQREMAQDDFAELHPDDQKPWLDSVEATIRVLQEELMAFNPE